MPRIIQSTVIVLFFLVMMGLLWRDEIAPRWRENLSGVEINRAVLADSWVNVDDWNEVTLGGRRIGILRTISEYDQEKETYLNHSMMDLDVSIVRARFLSTARLNRRLEVVDGRIRAQFGSLARPPLSFEELDSETPQSDVLDGRLRIDDRLMRVGLRRGSSARFIEQRLLHPITLADNIAPILRGSMLSRDVVYTTEVFDPLMGTANRIQVIWVSEEEGIINGNRVENRIIEIRAANMTMTLVVDLTGNILRREIPLMMGNISTADQNAKIIFRRMNPPDAMNDFPEFLYTPPVREVTQSEVTGTNSGELSDNPGLISILSGALMRRQ